VRLPSKPAEFQWFPTQSSTGLRAEGPPDDERNLWTPEAWIAAFQLDDCMNQLDSRKALLAAS
jgi:hypothetical protein